GSMAAGSELAVPPLASRFEARVANRENLIQDEHLADRFERYSVSKSLRHAARVVFQLQIGEALELGERQDFVEAASDFAEREAHDGSDEQNVVDRIKLRIPADAQSEDRRNRGMSRNASPIWEVDPTHDFQQ